MSRPRKADAMTYSSRFFTNRHSYPAGASPGGLNLASGSVRTFFTNFAVSTREACSIPSSLAFSSSRSCFLRSRAFLLMWRLIAVFPMISAIAASVAHISIDFAWETMGVKASATGVGI